MREKNLSLFVAFVALICMFFSSVHVTEAQKVTLDGQDHSLDFSKTIPNTLNYQGFLVNAADSSAVTATLEMTFRIYDAETDGTELWSETHPAVAISNGIFYVLLGSTTSFPADLFDGSTLWLQTEVGAEVFSPRKPLVSVAYSQKSQEADHAIVAGDTDLLDGQSLTDLDSRWMNIDDLDHLNAADGDPANVLSVDDDGKVGIGTTSPLTELDVAGSVNATTYYGDGSNLTGISGTTDNDWTIDADNIYHGAGLVGIGTASPSAKLDVQGTLNVGQNYFGYDVNFWGYNFNGSRVFWDAEKIALRAGRDTDGHHWAPDSMGLYSLATGVNTKASGEASTAMGGTTTASGENSTAMGSYTIASGNRSTAMGFFTTASGDFTTAIGRDVTAEADNSIVLGRGIDLSNPLINDIENSLMVGFNTDEPALFVGGSDNRVGIGLQTPNRSLYIAENVNGLSYPLKIDNYNGNWNVAVGMLFSAGGDGTPSGILSTSRGKGALVYEYTATWNRGKFHFLQNTATDSTNPNLSDAVLTIQNDGNVGIGTTSPGYRLQVGTVGDGTEARANAWNLFSSREYKKDISPLRTWDYGEVLQKLKELDVVQYRYKDDHPDRKLRLGIIAEEAPAELVSEDGKAMSLSDSVGFLLAAVKGLMAENEELRNRISTLEEER